MTDTPSRTTHTGSRCASRPGDRRYLAVVLGLPLVVSAAGAATIAWAWARIPDVVASHWGPHGVTATQTRAGFVLSGALLVLAVVGLLGALGWRLPADGRRTVATIVAVAAGFLVCVLTGVLVDQTSLADPESATAPVWLFAVGLGVGAVLGTLARVLIPAPAPHTGTPRIPQDAPALDAEPDERLAWFGPAGAAPWASWLVVGLVALACLLAVLVSPWAALGPVVALVAVSSFAHARVVVDPAGVRVTSFGFRWLTVPLDSVAFAEGSHLTAFREFGGLGMRYRPDARAFVTGTGPALLLVQQDGSRTYVSCADPEEAAGVVNTLLKARAARRPA